MEKFFIEQLPDRYIGIVKRLVSNGILDSDEDGSINASDEILEIFVVLGRLGLI